MSTDGYQTPDLASVLKTLAEYAPPQSSARQDYFLAETQRAPDEELEEGEYEPPEPSTAGALQPATHTPTPPRPASVSRVHDGSTLEDVVPQKPKIDATSITDWSAGLRCVMKTVARSDAIQMRIRKLIQVQHEHEKQWWEGRKALVERQSARAEGQKKLDDVLRSVGGMVPPSNLGQTPEDHAAELKRYDMKVYRASTEMAKAMSTELKTLGVPFFGMNPELVMRQSNDPAEGDYDTNDGGGGARKLKEGELMTLQRRMLELLEDMCKE